MAKTNLRFLKIININNIKLRWFNRIQLKDNLR